MKKLGSWPRKKPSAKPKNHGWLVEGTEKVLRRHLRPDMKVIVELGVWLGKSTKFFLEQCPKAHVYSVDLWDSQHLTQWAESKHPHLVEAAKRPLDTFMVNLWAKRKRVTPIQMDSIAAIAAIKKAGIQPDLIYLDTSHLYPETLNEIRAIKAAFPTVQLVGDDWEWGNRKHGLAVQKSVHEYVKTAPWWSIEQEGNGWALVPSFEGLFRWYRKKLAEYLKQEPLSWAITPMQGRAILRELTERKAKVVVELGAGFSSIVLQHWAAQTGATVYSVDTDPSWVRWVRGLLTEQRLPDGNTMTLNELRKSWTKGMADAVFIDHGVDGSHDTRIRDMAWASDMAGDEGILLIDDWRTVAAAGKSTRYTQRAASRLKELGWVAEVLPGCRTKESQKGVGLATRIGEGFLAARGPTTVAKICTTSGSRVGGAIDVSGVYYEHDLLWAISEKAKKGVYIDVGAHVGNHTAFFALECPSTHVVALEPFGRAVAALHRTVARSGIGHKVKVLEAAIHNSWPFATAVATADSRMIITEDKKGVPCYRIDDLVPSGERVAVIKADVDGLEANVLLSGEEVIKRDRPLLALEAWNQETEDSIRAVLEPWGYVQGQRYCSTPTHIWEWGG